MKKTCVFLFVLIIVSNSCENSDTPINGFFEALEKPVPRNKLMSFKNAPRDSVVFYFNLFEAEFLKTYLDSAQTGALDDFFRNIQITNHIETRSLYLAFAFHSKLNHKKFNHDEIMQDWKKEYSKLRTQIEKEAKLFELKQCKIMQANSSAWDIGDTIKITLPVKFQDGVKSACYCYNHRASIDCSNFDDSLKITGKILEKKYYAYFDSVKTDTTEIIFRLKILKLSNPYYKIFDEKYKAGDDLKLHLSAYGKPII